MEEKEAAYKKRGVPRIVTIKGNELYYKDPPSKDELYTYRCRKMHESKEGQLVENQKSNDIRTEKETRKQKNWLLI